MRWREPRAPLQGTLLGYRLAYRGQDTPEVGAVGWAGAEWPGGGSGGGDDRVDMDSCAGWVVWDTLHLGKHFLRKLKESRGGSGNSYLRIIVKSVSVDLQMYYDGFIADNCITP